MLPPDVWLRCDCDADQRAPVTARLHPRNRLGMTEVMNLRGLKGGWALGLLATVSACASDGAPTAAIENGLDACIVDASFLNYRFSDPIGTNGQTSSREVVIGTDVAYAVVVQPTDGKTCAQMAKQKGGTLWVTNQPYATSAGQLTTIRFDSNTATETPCSSIDYRKGLGLFSRLPGECSTSIDD